VGFDDDVMTLRQLLLRKDQQRLMLISMLGESGVGKRTLAEMIYEELCDEFDFAMFIWMPPDGTVDANLETIKMGIEDLLIPADQRVHGRQEVPADARWHNLQNQAQLREGKPAR
jgi:thymidylate kinase